MTKSTLLNEIKAVKADAELKEIEGATVIKLLDLVLDYVNDRDIRGAVEEVPL